LTAQNKQKTKNVKDWMGAAGGRLLL